MPHTSPDSPYLAALAERVLVFDGAMGTNIQRHHLTAEDYGGKALEGCNDHLVLTRPVVIRGIHESFLAVGCDVVLVETSLDILEVKAALAGFERLFAELGRRVPVQAQVTLDTSGRMLLGTDVASALTTLESLGVDVVGLNCSTGPEHMREPVRFLTAHSNRPISVIPNAGLPLNTGVGDAVYPLEPTPMATMLGEF